MSVSGNGEVLGAATAIGGWATLPYTAGNEVAFILNILVVGTGVLVSISFLVSRFLLYRLDS